MESISVEGVRNKNVNDENDNENLIESDSEKVAEKTTKENENKLNLYRRNPAFRYLDTIIQHLKFSKYHYATLFVCIFSIMCGGYMSSHYFFSKNLLMKKYSWTPTGYSTVFIFQNIIGAAGAFISVTSTTSDWDIHSNILISLIGFFALVMGTYFNEGALYIVIIFIFNYCHGFINNICCNFLLEEFKHENRELGFLFVSSFRLIGCLLYGLVEYIIYDKYDNEDPIPSTVGLAIIQLGLIISLFFFYESPRLLYYNEQREELYKYISKTAIGDVSKFKKEIIEKCKETETEIKKTFSSQKYTNLFRHFGQLWEQGYIVNSLKSIVFIFLSSFLMSNMKDSYSYFFDDKSQYLFIIEEDNKPHYKCVVYYIGGFCIVLLLTLLKHFLNLPRKYLCLGCLGGAFLFLIFMIIFNSKFIYFLCVFESLAFFYHSMVYMYFSTYTTTQLRNSTTSLLYISLTVSYIFQSVLLNSLSDYTLFAYINFGVTIVLALLEFFVIGKDTKDMSLQEIEIELLCSHNGVKFE